LSSHSKKWDKDEKKLKREEAKQGRRRNPIFNYKTLIMVGISLFAITFALGYAIKPFMGVP
jgi:hypothetical protein